MYAKCLCYTFSFSLYEGINQPHSNIAANQHESQLPFCHSFIHTVVSDLFTPFKASSSTALLYPSSTHLVYEFPPPIRICHQSFSLRVFTTSPNLSPII
ncbi:unnamed protein product [Citrullus colocynthis]|uniref:Uncharacterized protein n=1 Tax=Citrullus colocynthis TaxID=252529 RepID=A0ABP0YIH0_9ROSI